LRLKNPFGRRTKYLSKEQQIKRSRINGIFIGLIVTIVVIAVYQLLVIPRVKENEKILVMNNLQKAQSQNIYAVNANLLQGHVIEQSDLKVIRLPKELTPKDTISDQDNLVGKVLRMNLAANNLLTNSVVTSQDDKLTPDLRKQDYNHIILNYNLKKGDFVDIRIKYKDGSDYRVATKKKILDLNGTEAVYQISEDEREYVNNATVVAVINGGVLYTTIYKDPENQPAAEVNYVLNDNVKNLIKANPNIVKNAQDQLSQNVKAVPDSKQQTQNSTSSNTSSNE
jgi:hypothetical protein